MKFLSVLNIENIEIVKGEKIAFVGKNGEGKSTLAKMIAGQIDFIGNITLGHSVKMGYYAQNQAAITESPLNEDIIWVGTDDGNIQVTKNGGKSWKNVIKNVFGVPKNTWVYHIEASAHDENTAYVVFDGHTSGDMKAYAYKTNDLGETWSNIIPNNDVTGFTRNIQEDYENGALAKQLGSFADDLAQFGSTVVNILFQLFTIGLFSFYDH